MPRARSRTGSATAAGRRGIKRNAHPALSFNRKLVLNQWLLSLFGVERFDQLAEHLRDEALEGLDENNIHRFHHALCLHLRPSNAQSCRTICSSNMIRPSSRSPSGQRAAVHPWR
jgi:hypothetical protein